MTADDPPAIGIENEDYLKPDHHQIRKAPRTNDRKGQKRLLPRLGRGMD